jgi:hypothetical protein
MRVPAQRLARWILSHLVARLTCWVATVSTGLDEQIAYGQKQAAELEASAAALAALKADHADAVRTIQNDCEEKCRAINAELAERAAEVSTISGEVQAVKQAGQAALCRESAKADAAMLAMRAELERVHEEALREALELERARANEQRHKAVAEVEARAREEQRTRELEYAAQQARSRAEAVAQDQQRTNQAALSSYAAELNSLRESLGAKKSSLLPGSQSIPAAGRGMAAPDPYVSIS